MQTATAVVSAQPLQDRCAHPARAVCAIACPKHASRCPCTAEKGLVREARHGPGCRAPRSPQIAAHTACVCYCYEILTLYMARAPGARGAYRHRPSALACAVTTAEQNSYKDAEAPNAPTVTGLITRAAIRTTPGRARHEQVHAPCAPAAPPASPVPATAVCTALQRPAFLSSCPTPALPCWPPRPPLPTGMCRCRLRSTPAAPTHPPPGAGSPFPA